MGLFRYRALQGSSHSNEGHSPFQRRRESLTGSIRRFWPELKELLWLNWSQRHRRTPEVRQLETTECAAICLAIVLRYYERNEPLSALRRACGVSRNGSNAAQLVRAAGKYQLVAKGMKRGLNSLQEVPLPAVLFWEFNHFVVLEAITTQGIWVNNPATGRLRLTREEFDRAYTGIVISLIPSADFQSGGQRRAPFAELAQQLSRGQPRLSVGLIITQVVSIALAVLLISGERAATHTGLILGLVFSISLMPALITALTRSISGRSGASIQSKLLKMPEWALHQHSLQELSSRHQGLQRISDVIRGDLLWQISTVLLLLLWSGLQLTEQPWLVLLVLGGTSAVLALLMLDHTLQHPQHNQTLRQKRRARTKLEQSLEDPRTMKSLALERRVLQLWSGLQAEAASERLQQIRQSRLTEWLPELLCWLLPILMLILGGFSPPVLVPALLWWWVLIRLQLQLNQWREIGAPLNALAALDDEPTDVLLLSSKAPKRAHFDNSAIGVELNMLCFAHTPNEQPLFEALNLSVAAGEWLALTGRSGCGKSTLLNLIAGLLQPESGQVLLNANPLLDYSREQRSRTIAMVRQEDALLNMSLRENLTLWDPRISDAQLNEICADLGLQTIVEQLPHGLDTVLDPNQFNLSGGQRQLLNLGRVLLQKPQLLLLDEATSALDSICEKRVFSKLRQLDCTVIIASQRSSSVNQADRVIKL